MQKITKKLWKIVEATKAIGATLFIFLPGRSRKICLEIGYLLSSENILEVWQI